MCVFSKALLELVIFCFIIILFSFIGNIWSWGDGEFGKLGHGAEDSSDIPKMIDSFELVQNAYCGLDFSVCLTKDGKVFTWY